MSGFTSPNYTQIPNDLFDRLLALMHEAELKVVLYAARQTFGYHRESDFISLSQFVKATGLSRQGVLDGIEAAKARGLLAECGAGARGVKRYCLVVGEADQSTELTSQVSRPVPVHRSTELTSTGQVSRPVLVHQVDPQKKEKETPKKSNDSARRWRAEMSQSVGLPLPEGYGRIRRLQALLPRLIAAAKQGAGDDETAVIERWIEATGVIDPNAFKKTTNRAYARGLLDAGFTPNEVAAFVADRQQEEYWRHKSVPLSVVAKDIRRWKEAQGGAGQESLHPAAEDKELFSAPPGEERTEMPDSIRARLYGMRKQQAVAGVRA